MIELAATQQREQEARLVRLLDLEHGTMCISNPAVLVKSGCLKCFQAKFASSGAHGMHLGPALGAQIEAGGNHDHLCDHPG